MDILCLAEKGPFMPQKRTRAYPVDFRNKIVKLARVGRGADELADEITISTRAIVATGSRPPTKKTSRTCANACGNSKSSEIFCQKPRRGLLARPIRFCQSLRIRESAPFLLPVATQCRVLDVSTSGYYAWLTRKPLKRHQNNIYLVI